MKQKIINNNTMFSIDLLKGKGLPPKSGPVGMLLILSTALVPVFLSIVIYGLYSNNKVISRIKQQDMLQLEEDISELSGALTIKRNLERQKFFYDSCLNEVKSSIKDYKQWSPVLAILYEEMPSSILLKNLEVKHERIANNPSGVIDPFNTKQIMVTKLIFKISNSQEGDYSEQVKDFRNKLFASSALGPKLDNIVFSREANKNNGMETISYKIECLFKPES